MMGMKVVVKEILGWEWWVCWVLGCEEMDLDE